MQCFSLCYCSALACAFAFKAKANVFVMYWVDGGVVRGMLARLPDWAALSECRL